MFQRIEIRDVVAAIFILIGACFRFYGFYDWSLSNDELSALSRTNFNSFSELIERGIWVDGHPALIQIFEFYWVQIFGNSVFWIRLPFVLMGIGASIYVYKLLAYLLNKNSALIGLSLFIPNYLFVLYSQIARPYAAGLFFVMGFSFYLFRFLKKSRREPEHKYDTFGIVFFGLAASLTHYFSALTIFLIYLSASLYWNKRNIKSYFLLAFLIVLFYLPHLPITLNHLSIGGVSWLPKPEADYLQRFFTYFFQSSFLLQIAILISIIIIGIKKGLSISFKPFLISIFTFFSCFFIAYYYSIHRTPVIQFSVLIFAAPFLLVLIASVIDKKASTTLIIGLSSILLILGSYLLIAENEIYTKKPFANFKSVAENSVSISNELGQENVLSIANSSNPYYLKYYTSKMDSSFEFNIEKMNEEFTIAKVRDEVLKGDKEYVLIAYANSPVPAEIHEFTKQKYPVIQFHERYFNSDIIVYAKGNHPRKTFFESSFLNNNKWEVNKSFLQDSIYYSDSMAFAQKPDVPYALTFRDTLKNLVNDSNKYLTLSAQLLSKTAVDLSLVVNVTRGDSSLFWRGTNVKPFYTQDSWYQFMYVFEKPDNLLPSDQVVIYFWNPNKEMLYIDDFKINNFADSDFNYYEF